MTRIAPLASLMTIGVVCRTLKTTPRAIRFYEEKGLVRPRRDRLGVRMFDAADYRRVQDIVKLRRAGLPLVTIQTLFGTPDSADCAPAPETVIEKLLMRREQVARQLRAVDQTVEEWRARTPRGDAAPAAMR
jgi:DNA-binding transcriptional MerR regulator